MDKDLSLVKAFMQAVMKEARRYSLMEVLENYEITEEQYYKIIEPWFKNKGINL